jgi:hypothetical protein
MRRAESDFQDLEGHDDAFGSLESNTTAAGAAAAATATTSGPLHDTHYGAIPLNTSAGHDSSNTAQQSNLGRPASALGAGFDSDNGASGGSGGAGAGAAGHRRSISRRLSRMLPSAVNFSSPVQIPTDTLPIRGLAMSFEGLTKEQAAAKRGDSSEAPPLRGSSTAPAALPGAAKAASPRYALTVESCSLLCCRSQLIQCCAALL